MSVLAIDHAGRPVGAARRHFREPLLVLTPDGAPAPERPADGPGPHAGQAGVSPMAIRTARPRTWPNMVKPRTAGVASAGTPMDSTSRACTTTK